jgi:hypothetical protein
VFRLWYGSSAAVRSASISLLAAFLMACSYRDGPFVQTSGHAIDPSSVQQIVDGQTLASQVTGWFGEPQETHMVAPGRREMVYESTRRRDNVQTILFFRRRSYQIWRQRLEVVLDHDVVHTHRYTAHSEEH